MCIYCWKRLLKTNKPYAVECPFCRRRQENKMLRGFRELPWMIQGLVIFAVYKIILG